MEQAEVCHVLAGHCAACGCTSGRRVSGVLDWPFIIISLRRMIAVVTGVLECCDAVGRSCSKPMMKSSA